MAEFFINEGFNNDEKVEAKSFQKVDDYFYFHNDDMEPVFVMAAKSIQTIKRVDK